MNNEVIQYLNKYDSLCRDKMGEDKFIKHQKCLCLHHYQNNFFYKNIIDNIFGLDFILGYEKRIEDIPYLPIEIFKKFDLYSVEKNNIFKTLKSSGTTNNGQSKIYLDRENAKAQTIALSKVFTDFTKLNRPGMLICDSEDVIKGRDSFSARAAGVIGFSSLCRYPTYALDSNMKVSISKIEAMLSNTKVDQILLFGFTFIIWLHMLQTKLPVSLRNELNKRAVLVHGGGWKKLKENMATKDEFNQKVYNYLGIEKSINYYGMVEQTGTIFMECEEGYLHSNPLCTVLSRNKRTLEQSGVREVGITQVISSIPTSYPGNSILTDDLIAIKGFDGCQCGRKGVYFDILGRLKSSEPRGCSDTYNA